MESELDVAGDSSLIWIYTGLNLDSFLASWINISEETLRRHLKV